MFVFLLNVFSRLRAAGTPGKTMDEFVFEANIPDSLRLLILSCNLLIPS